MPGKQISNREKEIIVSQYSDGWPVRKIAAYASVSQTTVMKIVKEAGLRMRESRAVSDEKKEEVRKLYEEGMSIQDIIEATGVRSSQTIYTIIQAGRRNRKAVQ